MMYTISIFYLDESNYHSLSSSLPLSAATPFLIKLSSFRHQAHTEHLVHNACTGPFGCELLQDVTQHICNKIQLITKQSNHTNHKVSLILLLYKDGSWGLRWKEHTILIGCQVPSESLYSSKSISNSCSCSSVQSTIRVPILLEKKRNVNRIFWRYKV